VSRLASWLAFIPVCQADVLLKRGSQRPEVQMTIDSSELLLGFDHAGRAPAQHHLAATPALHVA
jgi:hypothetical protein